MSGDAEVPGRFGARGGLFTVPPLDSDRRHVIGAVLDVCREQSEDYVDRRKVDYRVQGSADTLGKPYAIRRVLFTHPAQRTIQHRIGQIHALIP